MQLYLFLQTCETDNHEMIGCQLSNLSYGIFLLQLLSSLEIRHVYVRMSTDWQTCDFFVIFKKCN